MKKLLFKLLQEKVWSRTSFDKFMSLWKLSMYSNSAVRYIFCVNYFTNQILIGSSLISHNTTVSTQPQLSLLSVSVSIECCLLCKHWIWSLLGSFFTESFHSRLLLVLLVRLWSDKQKTYMWTTTSRGTLNLNTKVRRCSRLRKMWRRTTCRMSEITAGKRDRRVSTSSSTLFICLFSAAFFVSSCVVFSCCLTQKQTCCTLLRCTGTTECARRPSWWRWTTAGS